MERRILLPAPEPLSPVRSQGPKVVQTGPKLPLKVIQTGPKVVQTGPKLPLKVMQTEQNCLESSANGAKVFVLNKETPEMLIMKSWKRSKASIGHLLSIKIKII